MDGRRPCAAARCCTRLGGGRVGAVTVFGFASDRERVEVLFTSLLLQAAGAARGERPPHPGESVAAYRRSWLHGFAVQVHRRLVDAERRAEQRAEQRAGSGAGPPAEARVRPVRRSCSPTAEARSSAPTPRRSPCWAASRRSVLSGSGFAAGAAAGERADLGAGALRGRRALGA